MTERGAGGRYIVTDPDPAESCRERDRRIRRERDRAIPKLGHLVAGHQGHGARRGKEEAIQETVVRRRCESCDQLFEAKVKDAICVHCGVRVEII